MPPTPRDKVLAELTAIDSGDTTSSTELFRVGEGGGYLDVSVFNQASAPASAVNWELMGKHSSSTVYMTKAGPFAADTANNGGGGWPDVFIGNPGVYYVDFGSLGVTRTNTSSINITFRNLWSYDG